MFENAGKKKKGRGEEGVTEFLETAFAPTQGKEREEKEKEGEVYSVKGLVNKYPAFFHQQVEKGGGR